MEKDEGQNGTTYTVHVHVLPCFFLAYLSRALLSTKRNMNGPSSVYVNLVKHRIKSQPHAPSRRIDCLKADCMLLLLRQIELGEVHEVLIVSMCMSTWI